MNRPTVYVFMNKSLNMSAGKLAAQAAHAVTYLWTSRIRDLDDFTTPPFQTMMVMQARNQEHLTAIRYYLKKRDIETIAVVDEGANETDPQVVTAVATQVVDKDIDMIKDIFGTFELYRDTIRFKVEVDR